MSEKKRKRAKKRTTKTTGTARQRTKQIVVSTGRAVGRAARKVGSKVIKVKKPREMLKGAVSVGINMGLQKVIEGISFSEKTAEGTDKIENGQKVIDVKKTAQVQGFFYLLVYFLGLGSILPKDYVSSEFIEINSLANGIKKFVSTSKSEKIRGLTPLFNGASAIEAAAAEQTDYFSIQATQTDVAENRDYFSIQGFTSPVQGVDEQYNDPFKL